MRGFKILGAIAVLAMGLLSVDFLARSDLLGFDKCEAAGGVMVKSSKGWTCIKCPVVPVQLIAKE